VGSICALAWLPAAAQAQSHAIGQWSDVTDWPSVAIHGALLPTGQVVYYPQGDHPWLVDPTTLAATALPKAGYNIFCSGLALMGDGRLLVAGGHVDFGWGLPKATIYDAITNSWSAVPDMNNGRWYPTVVSLGNSEVLVISGSYDTEFSINSLPQVWTGSGWRDLTSAVLNLPLYPQMHLAPDGRVFLAGPNKRTRWLDTTGTGSWSMGPDRTFPSRDYGTSVLYGDGKILYIGGGNPPTDTAEVIDLNETSPAWRTVGSMSIARRQTNATLLPDGKVLVTGGVSGQGFNNKDTPVFTAELWDPATESFTPMASMARPRWYHSTAVLLPDGRVLSAGGDHNPSAEVFSPPYLFKGARPLVRRAPTSAAYGEVFTIATPDEASIAAVNLVRLTSVTHANNMSQRINQLRFVRAEGGLKVTAPSDPNLCPPGHYMLFLLNDQGVPSVAPIIRIGPSS
jgi:hypothetical protein